MGLRRWLGLDELLRELLRVSAMQAETSARMAEALERLTVLMVPADPAPPEGRHINDALEADLFNDDES